MNNKIYTSLEFNKIRTILSTYAVTYIGKELCENLEVSTNQLEIKRLQDETQESLSYYLRQHDIPISPISDITNILHKAQIGGILSIKDLLKVSDILHVSRRLKSSFRNGSIEESDFPMLFEKFNILYENKKVEEEIERCIKNEDELDDRASQELYKIRKSIRETDQSVKEKLNSLLRSKSKYLQEDVISLRDDRYVLLVKSEYRNEVPGLIHDQSSTGSTIFIEPTSIFNLNNEIKELKLKETQEVQRILALLSQMISPICDNINTSLMMIGNLDFVFAKGKYAAKINAYPPTFDEKRCDLKKARHPLIPESQVVPIDIWFGDNIKQLIITGPNTGGKTVTLKTVGLLSLMAQAGLHIPCEEGSKIKIFENIYSDIGDEQSIEQSLSTFSAHMTNIVSILNNVTSNDLVLIDEIGSGTDPVEGAAIAMAILEYLHKKDVLTLATTHYSELKSFAIETEGVENASSEFDVDTLKPTYKLLIGIPGKSNAFAISKKLGLNEEILKRANTFLSDENIKFEDVLSSMEYDRRKAEEERTLSKKLLEEAKNTKLKMDEEKEKLDKQKAQILSKAKQQARDLLLDAEEEAKDIIKELSDLKKNSNKNETKIIEENRSKIKKSIKEIQNDLATPSSVSVKNPLNKKDIVVGMEVYIPSYEQDGVICKLPDKSDNVLVQIGIVKIKIHISQLEKKVSKEKAKVSPTTTKSINKAMDISTEVMLIGMTTDEAIPVLEKYIDDAYLSNMGYIRIVHGKGTGTLKRAVHTFLKNHPHVKSYRLGMYGEGDTGVTIAEIS